MAQASESKGLPPRIIILSESGPLGGDLSACLSGRFTVERVTSLSGAGLALGRPAAALLVVPDRRDRVRPDCLPLLRQAVASGCRVLLLGFTQVDLEDDLKDKVFVLPHFPSPGRLFEGLGGLSGTENAAEA